MIKQCNLAMIEISSRAKGPAQRLGLLVLAADGFLERADRRAYHLPLVQEEIIQIVAVGFRVQPSEKT